ncbi:hypothetical protein [Agromyces sp. LHK192]|uniref:hypothetical protein n=1 Tax=Agromyces sp. LHK192 TaxID=2498704 RepID=UPI000FD81CF1|nr:hypothetical protein [Agromyces sp. LHK192]
MTAEPDERPQRRLGFRVGAAEFGIGAVIGAIAPFLGYQAATALLPSVTDLGLILIAIAPTALLLVSAVVPAWRGRAIAIAIGCACGTIVTLAIVLGGISAIAWLLSDPAGAPQG